MGTPQDSMSIAPFEWVVTQEEIDDLYVRIDKTRWPHQLSSPANDNWLYGTELAYIKELVSYWRNEYNVAKNVASFNRMPQFTTSIAGRRLHFVHRRCANPSATPILLAHGWPGSVHEFHKIVEPLARDFHVVAPSIPGYAWSDPPEHRGHTYVVTARHYHALMLRLGYTRYCVHGGDWGAAIVKSLAVLYPHNIIALHTTMPIVRPPPHGTVDPPPTPDEAVGVARMAEFRAFGTAYQKIQGSKPQTLSYGLTDSPVGLLAWVLEKYRAWTDNEGDPSDAVSRDEMLTNVMIYWCSACIGPSVRYYFENGTGPAGIPGRSMEPRDVMATKCTVPTAVARFPKELYQPTLPQIERSYNLIKHTRFVKGGHFAGWEAPDELVRDIKAFFLGYPFSKM